MSKNKNSLEYRFSILPVMSHDELTLIRISALHGECRSSSDSDSNCTVISNTDGSQNVETDQWDFEETVGDKISDGNTFRGDCGGVLFLSLYERFRGRMQKSL